MIKRRRGKRERGEGERVYVSTSCVEEGLKGKKGLMDGMWGEGQ